MTARPSDPDAVCPGGCHDGDAPGFDHYLDAKGIRDEDIGPEVFAAWLNAATGGDWDGDPQEVDDVSE